MLVSNQDSKDGILITIRPPFFRQPVRERKNLSRSFKEGVNIALMQIPKSQSGAFLPLPLISARTYSTFFKVGCNCLAMERFFAEISSAYTFLNRGERTGSHFPMAQPISMTVFFLEACSAITDLINAFLSLCKTSNISSP